MVKRYLKKIYYLLISKKFGSCGHNVILGRNCSFAGEKNIYIGNNVQIGRNSIIWSTVAKVHISNNVVFGPNVSIHSGNHDIHFVGKHIIDVKNEEANQNCFSDVWIEEGVWCGDGVKILKGVTIAKGCVIGAGSVVNKSTEPYGIYSGVPAVKIGNRFTEEQIKIHESLLRKQ